MALTETPLNMANATQAFAKMDTSRQVRILVSQGQNHATERLLGHLRGSHPDVWSSLIVGLGDTPQWGRYVADLLPAARRSMAA